MRLFVEDGRSFVRRSTEKYQVLQATLVDTWASTAAGAFALSENNLYTTDAFHDYLSHLTDDGILAFTRWGFEPPRESLRLISLAHRGAAPGSARTSPAARDRGARGQASATPVAGARDTVLISRKPFSAPTISSARTRRFGIGGLTPVYLPDRAIDEPIHRLPATRPIRPSSCATIRSTFRPVTDDRPFFFYTVQPRDLIQFLAARPDAADYKINRAVPLLFGLLGISLLATLIVLVLPPLVLGSGCRTSAGAPVPALLPVHRRRLHPDRGGADPEVRAVSRPSDVRAHRGHLLDADFERLRQLHEPPHRRPLEFPPERRDGRGRRCRRLLAPCAGPLTESGVGWPDWLKVILTVLMIAPPAFLWCDCPCPPASGCCRYATSRP